MKIVSITPSYYPASNIGGPVSSSLILHSCLSNMNEVEVSVLTTDVNEHRGQKKLNAEMCLRAAKELNHTVEYFRTIGRTDVSVGQVYRYFKLRKTADFVFITGSYNLIVLCVLFLNVFFRKKIFWFPRGGILATFNGHASRRYPLKKLFELCLRLFLSEYVGVVCSSRIEREAIISSFPNSKCYLLKNGVEMPICPDRPTKQSRSIKLLFVGRISKIKNLQNLIIAIAKTSNVTLDIVGPANECEFVILTDLAKRLQISEKINFIGVVPNNQLKKYYLEATALVLPSFSENFGNVVAEALSFGTPCIVSDQTPWGEYDQTAGIIVSGTASEAIASAITHFRTLDFAEMSRNARIFAEKELELNKVMKVFKNILDEAVSR